MKRKLIALIAAILLIFVSSPSIIQADTPVLVFTIHGGYIEPFPFGNPWQIKSGQLTLEYFSSNSSIATYAVKACSLNVQEPSGINHTLTVVPDGLPSPIYSGPLPMPLADSGFAHFYTNFYPIGNFFDMLFWDLSIDGQPVNQADSIGGPGLIPTYWTGGFPLITSFTFTCLGQIQGLGFSTALIQIRGSLIQAPAISNWGEIALILLFSVSTVWLLTGRKKKPTRVI